ncbi:MAG: hypothetical protein QM426_05090 [Euryarchaeota archaeon]|nr:hypothetical protein [Euryarchaeota archaeon]
MNLQTLIKSGESETLEFKEKFDERTVESAVAFANASRFLKSIRVFV